MKVNGKNDNIMVNGSITFNELLNRLGEVKKELDSPTPKMLQETQGEPIAQTEDGMILAYANGYAVYDNGNGRTVLWIPECGEFTYRFQSGSRNHIKIVDTIGIEIFGNEPWFLAIMINGDHRIDDNMVSQKSYRSEN